MVTLSTSTKNTPQTNGINSSLCTINASDAIGIIFFML